MKCKNEHKLELAFIPEKFKVPPPPPGITDDQSWDLFVKVSQRMAELSATIMRPGLTVAEFQRLVRQQRRLQKIWLKLNERLSEMLKLFST